jgi:hypothetical protein
MGEQFCKANVNCVDNLGKFCTDPELDTCGEVSTKFQAASCCGENADKASGISSCVPYNVTTNEKVNSLSSASVQSRYLAPWGAKASLCESAAWQNAGLHSNADIMASSPFPRCGDNLKDFALAAGKTPQTGFAGMVEPFMYTGSLTENMVRKGYCDKTQSPNTEAAYQYIFDEMRKAAGTPPLPEKNNWITTHGFNMKGAFGNQIDEGYWMCIKPTNESYPATNGSLVHTWDVGCHKATPSVNFTGVKQFGVDFILSSEAFSLMDACNAQNESASASDADPGGLLHTAESMEITAAKALAVNKMASFTALLAIQNEARMGKIPVIDGVIKNDTLQIGLWTHQNVGYRAVSTVHVPLRRPLLDTIHQLKGLAEHVWTHTTDGDLYASCTGSAALTHYSELSLCSEAVGNGQCYWGGSEKSTINTDSSYYSTAQYDADPAAWFGNPTSFGPYTALNGTYPPPLPNPLLKFASCLVVWGRTDLAAAKAAIGCQ